MDYANTKNDWNSFKDSKDQFNDPTFPADSNMYYWKDNVVALEAAQKHMRPGDNATEVVD